MQAIKLNLVRLHPALMALLILTGCALGPVAGTPQIHRVIVFGDSNVDNGNLFHLTGEKYPAPPRWNGRESNGPVVVEYLAKDLHATLQDYAVSGATSGEANIISRISAAAGTGMSHQLDQFFRSGETLTKSDLVVIWAGSNDIFDVRRENQETLTKRIATVSSNLEQALIRLHAQGAAHIIVANRSPRPAVGSDNDLNGVDLNAAITKTVRRIRADYAGVILYDDYAAILDMVTHPSSYGFTEVSKLCVQEPACAQQNVDTLTVISDTYINWDGAHKTTRVHRLLAQQMLQLLSE